MRLPPRHALIACLLLLAAPAPALAEGYIGVIIGSHHFGNDTLNDVNPGLTYGRRWAARTPGVEYHLEGGVFYNSYEEVSPILFGGISTHLADLGPGELRVGASIGTGYYKELSQILRDSYGIPNIHGFIPIASLTASYRLDRTEFRLTTVPPDTDTTAILNLSVAVGF